MRGEADLVTLVRVSCFSVAFLFFLLSFSCFLVVSPSLTLALSHCRIVSASHLFSHCLANSLSLTHVRLSASTHLICSRLSSSLSPGLSSFFCSRSVTHRVQAPPTLFLLQPHNPFPLLPQPSQSSSSLLLSFFFVSLFSFLALPSHYISPLPCGIEFDILRVYECPLLSRDQRENEERKGAKRKKRESATVT